MFLKFKNCDKNSVIKKKNCIALIFTIPKNISNFYNYIVLNTS